MDRQTEVPNILPGNPEQEFRALIETVYSAFNRRDIDRALSVMTGDVQWSNGWEGGFVYGHDGVRSYWTRQWVWAAAGSVDTDLSFLRFLERYRTDVAECRMAASRIVEPLDVIEHLGARLFSRPQHLPGRALDL